MLSNVNSSNVIMSETVNENNVHVDQNNTTNTQKLTEIQMSQTCQLSNLTWKRCSQFVAICWWRNQHECSNMKVVHSKSIKQHCEHDLKSDEKSKSDPTTQSKHVHSQKFKKVRLVIIPISLEIDPVSPLPSVNEEFISNAMTSRFCIQNSSNNISMTWTVKRIQDQTMQPWHLHSLKSKSVKSVNIPTCLGMLPFKAFESIDHCKKKKHGLEHDIKNPLMKKNSNVVALTQFHFGHRCQQPNFTWNSASQSIWVFCPQHEDETWVRTWLSKIHRHKMFQFCCTHANPF